RSLMGLESLFDHRKDCRLALEMVAKPGEQGGRGRRGRVFFFGHRFLSLSVRCRAERSGVYAARRAFFHLSAAPLLSAPGASSLTLATIRSSTAGAHFEGKP